MVGLKIGSIPVLDGLPVLDALPVTDGLEAKEPDTS